MSADSPRRGSKVCGMHARPQPVSDKSVMESVVDFFHEAYSGGQKTDDREKIQWVRFEQADINDHYQNPDCNSQSGATPPLLILIGYTNGVQIWTVPASGEAQEVMSLRQGPVRVLRVLPTPKPVFGHEDIYESRRPLIALCDASSAGQPYCSVKFVSLRTGDEVHNIPFKNPVADVKCNERIVVVTFPEKIAAFDACSFKQQFLTVSCFPSPGPNPNPIALGSRWLAYADKKLVPVHQSCGGMSGDGGQSIAATVISATKTITKGLTMFGETVAQSLTGVPKPPSTPKKDPSTTDNGYRPGIVTIIDIQDMKDEQVCVQEDSEGEGLVAHFPAHASEPVSAMEFDPSGTLLLTADRLGHNFHVFRIMAHPWSCSLGAVHHLYTLHRGDTTAKVQDIKYSLDSRWVAITTYRGTTHVFPITPYGGPVNVRTHKSVRVVNRASRFQRSAGLDDMDAVMSSGRHSPILSSSPGSSPSTSVSGRPEHYRSVFHQNTLNNNIHNPRLPPYPHPTRIQPLVQLRQTLTLPGLGSSGSAKAKKTSTTPQTSENMCTSACFARSRGWVAGSNVAMDKADRPVDSLFIINCAGTVTEYMLEPHAKTGLDKVTDDSPLQVTVTPRAQWSLVRCINYPELSLPLATNNLLLQAQMAVLLQQPSAEMSVTRQESKESLASDHSSTKDDLDEAWLSQVEIITHAGPHRRLWMGPQFSFKTYKDQGTTILPSNSSVLLSQSPDAGLSTMDLVSDDVDLQSLQIQSSACSSPMAMPKSSTRVRKQRHSSGSLSDMSAPSPAGLLIEAGSYEQSPNTLLEGYPSWPDPHPPVKGGEVAEDKIRESLEEAMTESPQKGQSGKPDVYLGSLDNLSTSSGSTSSAPPRHSFDARSSPPHSIEHVLVFPSNNESPDSM